MNNVDEETLYGKDSVAILERRWDWNSLKGAIDLS